MTYEEMLNEVCAGKTAYRPTNPDMIVFREGDTIIRRTHRKIEINQIFIASVEEQKATDWDIVDEDENHDGLHISCAVYEVHIDHLRDFGRRIQ